MSTTGPPPFAEGNGIFGILPPQVGTFAIRCFFVSVTSLLGLAAQKANERVFFAQSIFIFVIKYCLKNDL